MFKGLGAEDYFVQSSNKKGVCQSYKRKSKYLINDEKLRGTTKKWTKTIAYYISNEIQSSIWPVFILTHDWSDFCIHEFSTYLTDFKGDNFQSISSTFQA